MSASECVAITDVRSRALGTAGARAQLHDGVADVTTDVVAELGQARPQLGGASEDRFPAPILGPGDLRGGIGRGQGGRNPRRREEERPACHLQVVDHLDRPSDEPTTAGQRLGECPHIEVGTDTDGGS
jgi:hypothetical protein